MAIGTIGIVSTGDMGHAVGRTLREGGFRVVTALEGRSERSRTLAAKGGSEDIGDLTAAISGDIDADVVSGDDVATRFKSLAPEIRNVIHIKRGGDISGQQLGTYMLDRVRKKGGRRVVGDVRSVTESGTYNLDVENCGADIGNGGLAFPNPLKRKFGCGLKLIY